MGIFGFWFLFSLLWKLTSYFVQEKHWQFNQLLSKTIWLVKIKDSYFRKWLLDLVSKVCVAHFCGGRMGLQSPFGRYLSSPHSNTLWQPCRHGWKSDPNIIFKCWISVFNLIWSLKFGHKCTKSYRAVTSRGAISSIQDLQIMIYFLFFFAAVR